MLILGTFSASFMEIETELKHLPASWKLVTLVSIFLRERKAYKSKVKNRTMTGISNQIECLTATTILKCIDHRKTLFSTSSWIDSLLNRPCHFNNILIKEVKWLLLTGTLTITHKLWMATTSTMWEEIRADLTEQLQIDTILIQQHKSIIDAYPLRHKMMRSALHPFTNLNSSFKLSHLPTEKGNVAKDRKLVNIEME